MNFDLKVEGLSALQEQLLNLGAEAGAKALTAATRKAFLPVLERARALARRLRSGHSLRSCKNRSGRTRYSFRSSGHCF